MFSQEIQPIVAEEHLSIGDECRRTEDAAIARLTARLRERHVALAQTAHLDGARRDPCPSVQATTST